MDRYDFRVQVGEEGMRLDVYLHEKIPSPFSRTDIQNRIKNGEVSVNGLKVKSHYRVKEDDLVSASLTAAAEIDLVPEDIPLDVVFEDESLLIINKPAGLVVHPGSGVYRGTLVNALLSYSNSLSSLGGKFKPGIVHRLDKDTSGLLVVAKTDAAHMELARQFKAHTIFRRYIALVKGVVELDEGDVDVPVGRHLRDRTRMAVNFGAGRESKTFYRALKRYKDFTLIEVYPRTGRTHQIRVHMAHIGHPVLGDRTYGTGCNLIGRQALHAADIGFLHPATKKEIKFSSDLPEDIKALVPDYKGK